MYTLFVVVYHISTLPPKKNYRQIGLIFTNPFPKLHPAHPLGGMAKVQKVGREAGHQVTNPKGLSQMALRWLIARWESQVPVQATVERLELWMCFPWVFLGDERVYHVQEIDRKSCTYQPHWS